MQARHIRGLRDSPTHRYGESATPRLTDAGSWGVYKRKIKALDLYVCLLLHASLVQLKSACAKTTVHFQFFSAVGYSAKKI
jgi:hypothetical protein